jgi:GTP cyclohydrolase I
MSVFPIHHRVTELEAQNADFTTALAGVRAMLRLLGMDPDANGLEETPSRWVRAYLELGSSEHSVADILDRTFTLDAVDSVVAVGPIEFVSLCEHHLLPFTGKAWVAYKPQNNTVVGLSKLPRLVQHLARRPQVQERLTEQITTAITDYLPTAGAACLIRGAHSCMTMRGVRSMGAEMVTSSMVGIFRTVPEARAEFLALAHGG